MKRLITGLIVALLMLGTVACAASERGTPTAVPVPAPAPAPESPPMGINIPSSSKVIEMPPAVSDGAGQSVPAMAPAPIEEEGDYGDTDRMIVRTGDMVLVVADVASAIEQITALAGSYDGYVVSSSSWRDNDRLVGSIAIRVNAERFNDAIRALRGLAVEVTQESTSGKDVTEEYVDLSAKLHNLEASEAQLLKLMEKAGEVSEILEVQRELTKTRGEIEQTKGRMQYLEQTSSTSLINVRLEQAELDVNFTASSRTVKTGENIRFEPRIAGGISPYSYEWDFGDGSTSTEVAPVHSYKAEGNYNVTLTVTDDRGQTADQERNNYIDVLPGWSAGNIASGAWNGLVGFGRVLADILIWLGIFSPVWIIIGVIVYFAWWRRRKKA